MLLQGYTNETRATRGGKERVVKTARYIDSLRNANNELRKENSLLLVKVERYSSQKIRKPLLYRIAI